MALSLTLTLLLALVLSPATLCAGVDVSTFQDLLSAVENATLQIEPITISLKGDIELDSFSQVIIRPGAPVSFVCDNGSDAKCLTHIRKRGWASTQRSGSTVAGSGSFQQEHKKGLCLASRRWRRSWRRRQSGEGPQWCRRCWCRWDCRKGEREVGRRTYT